MNERVKFRCFHKRGKKYIPLIEISFETNEVVVYQEKNSIVSMSDVILEQFTGILDRNGREIYENDIIRDKDGESWNIGFYNGSWYAKKKGVFYQDKFLNVARNGVVIGTVHDKRKEETTILGET